MMLSLPLLATAFVAKPMLAPRVAMPAVHSAPVLAAKMSIVDDIKDSILPKNTDSTLSNVVGLQMTGWGIGSLLFPTRMMDTLFGVSIGGPAVPLLRGMGLGMLSLGAKNCAGGDSSAAMDGFIFYGAWYKVLGAAVAAGTIGAYSNAILTWNMLVALACARRMGGLFDTVTKLDMGFLSGILPRDQDLNLRNALGIQLLGWGVICTFFQGFFFGDLIVNAAAHAGKGAAITPILAMMGTGLGIANTLMAGRVFGGSNKDAAANGAFIIGGFGIIGYLGKASGLLSGSMMGIITLWNIAFAGYCIKEML